jgi:hypothetical protein
VVASCSRLCSEPAPAVDATPADVAPEVLAKTSRCTEEGPLLRIAQEDQVVEVGGAALGGTQAVLGLVIGGRSKVVLYHEGTKRTVDFGVADPSSPPPVAIADGTDVLVARAVRTESVRSIAIDRITESAGPRPFASIPTGSGDDLDFDAAIDHGTGLVAWTFGESIETASVGRGDAGAHTTLAKPRGDVSSPRLLGRTGGWYLAYLVTRVDSDASVKGAAPWWDNDVVSEGPADRVWPGWVEIATLDSDGRPINATFAVTSPQSRVTAFDWAPSVGGLDVLARDAVFSGEGASLLHVHVDGSTAQATKTLADGLGPGAPVLFQETWAAFMDPNEGVHVLTLDSKETREPVLDGTQPLVAIPDGPKMHLVAVRVGEHGRGAELRIASCTR